MRLTARQLNRTLLQRQHLLTRATLSPPEMVHHLVGLQAQENLPPYLGLAARIEGFDPYAVSDALADRTLVRMLTLRGTIHLLVPEDALSLRRWTQPVQERELRSSQNTRPALEVDREAFVAAVSDLLADGPLPQRALSAALAERFPEFPAAALGQVARVMLPLVQVPPRGQWKASGGVVYQYVDRWLGAPMVDPDVEEVVRRHLRAFGPAAAADVTTWSGVSRLGPVLAGMTDLVRHEDERGKVLYDVPGGEVVDEGVPAPARLLGTYDNVWLSHAARDRVMAPVGRADWMNLNGASASTVFVDGTMTGLWRLEDGRVTILGLHRKLTRAERADLDEEIARVEDLLRR